MVKKFKNVVFALVLTIIVGGIANTLFSYFPYGGFISRIGQICGGELPHGMIQLFIFFLFFLGLFEVYDRFRKISYERQSLGLNFLPEQEHWVLSPDDVNDLKLKMIDYEKQHKFLLTGILRKAATKFRTEKSVSDVMQIVSSQVNINFKKSESAQAIVRYIIWAIPSIGLIGTILGIAQSLGLADRANDPVIMKQITSSMYVAYDATLVALILSLIIMWWFHQLQEQEEELHNDMEEYIMENFVNRIHVE